MDQSSLCKIVDSILPDAIAMRHQIHKNPELAGQEFKTSSLIRESLASTAIELQRPFLQTDVVGILQGSSMGKNVTLRADMDALPLCENSDKNYKSQIDGIMHGCGHDGHSAMLYGTALVLNQLRDTFEGSVRFVFQPGEEIKAMGKDLVEAGALLDPQPNAVFALHGQSKLPVGSIACKSGAITGAAGFFKITIKGRGGHASSPENTIDPILIGAKVVENLQSIVSRVIPAKDPAVLSVCRFEGGLNGNVIPDQVEMEGTFRYLDPKLADVFSGEIEKIVKGVCLANGASYDLQCELPYIATINSAEMVDMGFDITQQYFGQEAWHQIEHSSMGGEDFAYYLTDYPGALFRLGVGEDAPALHNPSFDFNDDAMRNGIIFMTAMTLNVLKDSKF